MCVSVCSGAQTRYYAGSVRRVSCISNTCHKLIKSPQKDADDVAVCKTDIHKLLNLFPAECIATGMARSSRHPRAPNCHTSLHKPPSQCNAHQSTRAYGANFARFPTSQSGARAPIFVSSALALAVQLYVYVSTRRKQNL